MAGTAKEHGNQVQFDDWEKKGPVILGPYTSHIWRHDPKHLQFLFSRYLFVSKMLQGKGEVLEVGCGDAIGTPIVLQTVGKVYGTDFEPLVIEAAKKCMDPSAACEFFVQDITEKPFHRKVDAAFSLDCIEHIPTNVEHAFYRHIAASLKEDGVFIMGTPNVTAQAYASAGSREGHVNLQSHETMRASLAQYFRNVFLFSMNDGMVHTGYYPMAQYLVGMGVGLR